MNKLSFVVLATVTALSLASQSASAADEIVTKSEVVRFGDLNLSSDAGIHTLYQRIRKAARKVCSQANDSVHLEQRNFRACENKAVADAVDKVNRPSLTAMYRSQNPRPLG
jgi:UrcA family protein